MPDGVSNRAAQPGDVAFYERILDRIGSLGEQVRLEIGELRQSLNHDLSEIKASVSAIATEQSVANTRLGAVSQDVARLTEAVFIGNGRPGLLARVASLEKELLALGNEAGSAVQAVDEAVTKLKSQGSDHVIQLRSEFESLRDHGSDHFLQLRSEFDSMKRDYNRVVRMLRWLGGLLVTTLLGLAATLLVEYFHTKLH